jgi:hypothetical protein
MKMKMKSKTIDEAIESKALETRLIPELRNVADDQKWCGFG